MWYVSRMTTRLLAALLSLCLAGAGHAADPLTVGVQPNPAGEFDPVTVSLHGIWNDGCVPVFAELLAGVDIAQPAGEPPYDHTWRITFAEPLGPGVGCPAAVTEFESQFRFASLPPGRNAIRVEVIRWVLQDQQIIDLGVQTVDIQAG